MENSCTTELTDSAGAYRELREREAMAKRLNHVPWKKDFKANWIIYVLFLPVLLWLVVFHYIPLAISIPLVFKEYDQGEGLFNSPWSGWDNFKWLFTGGGAGSSAFLNALRNTCVLGLLNLTIGYIVPVIFALIVSQVRFKKYRRTCQMISYLPNFVAAVVIVQIMQNLLAQNGALTTFMSNVFGMKKQDWVNVNQPGFWFWYIAFGTWQAFGYGSITYISAISNIDGTLYEAASIDGANRWQMMWRITIPCIMPMVIMLWMLQIGLVFKVGMDKTYLLYNASSNAEYCDTLFSYTMRMTMGGDLGLATASSLFQSIVGMALMVIANWLSRKAAGVSMF